ncbi:hypothetical protein [Pseudopontixanthobacter vadosimaris]|uniref:hypothetical protein n=1 Tax=Pseudopontixanthobacter vadosimaris TaxID=2726450 RepID=UPI001472D4DB|nr:hypothetical protein [Pseudopontixanthobacter vadosimaris]
MEEAWEYSVVIADMPGKPDLRLVSDGDPDKSKIFGVYNSRQDERIVIAQSEYSAIQTAKAFGHVRTISALAKQFDRNLIERRLGRTSPVLADLLQFGAQGKIEMDYSMPFPTAPSAIYIDAQNKRAKRRL